MTNFKSKLEKILVELAVNVKIHRSVKGIDQATQAILDLVKGEVEKTEELHTHNSIPSFIGDLDEGCSLCIKNKALEDLLERLK